MKKKTVRQKQIDKLDGIHSELVRRRAILRVGGCEKCLSEKHDIVKENGDIYPDWMQLQCSHYYGRKKLSVRWNEDNAAGLCGGCHMYFEHNPKEHEKWFEARLGDNSIELEYQATRPAKVDLLATELYLKQKLKELQ